MAEALSANTSLNEELEDLALDEFKIIKTSKGKDAVLHDGTIITIIVITSLPLFSGVAI